MRTKRGLLLFCAVLSFSLLLFSCRKKELDGALEQAETDPEEETDSEEETDPEEVTDSDAREAPGGSEERSTESKAPDIPADNGQNTGNVSDGGHSDESLRTPGTYSTFTVMVEPFDAGPAVTKLILDMKEPVRAQDIDVSKIAVTANHNNTRRNVTAAYPSDESGCPVTRGNYLSLELEHTYSGRFSNGAAAMEFDFSTLRNKLTALDHSVTISGPQDEIRVFTQGNLIHVLEDEFSYETSESGLNYRLYRPEGEEQPHPLIIWLHGMGDGGSDNRLQIVGSKACNLASEEIQNYFGGAYVAAPQCPDFWVRNFDFKAESPYLDQIISLIEEVIANTNTDPARIYIGGCSMGGYMTWRTILARPELFAAAFPTCAAYTPTAEDARKIAESGLPIWIIYSADDKIVAPGRFTRPSVKALKDAGADLKVTEFENVTEDGISYNGHYSWIYVYNNHVTDENGLSLMEWLATQSR